MSRNKRRKKKRKQRVRCWACFTMQARAVGCAYCGELLTPHGQEEPPQQAAE